MPLIAALLLLGVAGGGTWWWLARPQAPAPAVIATTTPPPSGKVETPPIKPPETAPAPNRAPVPVVQVPPPQPPPEPVVQPGQQQLAAVGLDILRRQIARWVSGRICALLGGTLAENGTVTLNGLADRQSIEDLREGLGSFVTTAHTDWRVDCVDPVFCPALNALSLLTPAFGDTGGPRLGLQMVDGKTRLHDGEPVRVRVVAPAFASRLRVDYIAHDGAVQHLYPQLADPKNRIAADPPRVFAPDEAVRLADPSWTISEPYGTDMIIAVASSEPLFDRPRAKNSEPAEAYLRDLRLAIDSLRQRGVRLAGAAITVEALPK